MDSPFLQCPKFCLVCLIVNPRLPQPDLYSLILPQLSSPQVKISTEDNPSVQYPNGHVVYTACICDINNYYWEIAVSGK
jgi:hypothetical protein